MAAPNLDKLPIASDEPVSAVQAFVETHYSKELFGLYGMTDEEAFTSLGLTVVERFQAQRGPLKLQVIVDDLMGGAPETRSQQAYDMETLVAATAIELAYLTRDATDFDWFTKGRRLLRELWYSPDATLPHLQRLHTKEPFRMVGASAVAISRDYLIAQYTRSGNLTDIEDQFRCAQLIGSALAGSLSLVTART